jgi:hypothetical protein
MRPTALKTGFRIAASCAALTVAACNTSSSGEGNTLTNLLQYGGTTAPPIAAVPVIDVADCPAVDIGEGGAAMRTIAGRSAEAEAVRSQISIANVARECAGRADGAVIVKVGIEGRALAGPGGSVSRADVPVYVVLKRGDRILDSQSRRGTVTVEPGGMRGGFVVVADNLVVPPGIGSEFEIEVGLGTAPGRNAAPTRTRRRTRG